MNFVYCLVLMLLVSGCVFDSAITRRDDSARVRAEGESRARKDFSCDRMVAGRTVRSVRMTDWGEPLFAEYRLWVEGCGKHVTYTLTCQEDEEVPCQFSDAIDVRDD